MAGRPGFEPGYTESESVVLPLNDPPVVYINDCQQTFGRGVFLYH
jgi:hypothetical protein